MHRDWDEHYASGHTPWDRDAPAPELVHQIEAGHLPRGRALDVGCGTGTSARYLASLDYDVVGIDVSRRAIERAVSVAPPPGVSLEFRQLDFLGGERPGGRFDLVFDRGCFHVFDHADDQARFAAGVADCLADDGLWLSLLGSTEGPPRDHGPPRRSARDIVSAVEPVLEVVELRSIEVDSAPPTRVRGWLLLARRRSVPAQPSTT